MTASVAQTRAQHSSPVRKDVSFAYITWRAFGGDEHRDLLNSLPRESSGGHSSQHPRTKHDPRGAGSVEFATSCVGLHSYSNRGANSLG